MKQLFSLSFLAVLLLASCKNDPPPPVVEPAPLSPLDSVEVITTPDPYFLKKYVGNIDGQQNIEAVLINWGDGFISGRYWYPRKGYKPIELSGEANGDGTLEFAEFMDGNEGAKFNGDLGANKDTITGTWTSADGKRNLPFSLFHVPSANDAASWEGNWHLNQVWDSGWLMVGNLTQDSFDFALTVVRGSHVGTLEGRASYKADQAIFKQKTYENEPCELRFVQKGDHVLIEQASSNLACGFGARAHAGGRFERRKLLYKSELTVGTGDDDAFPTQALHDEFRRLVGDRMYELFAFNMQVKERITNAQGLTVVTGAVPGLFTTNEAVIVFDKSGKIWAATLDFKDGQEEPFVRHFTNDSATKKKIHVDIETWRERFKHYKVVFQ
ncbi:MAG: hypothetical protein MUC59_00640 [Saprospiraceae bacterium]|nr:hypothetical protein [Saprospiraceae bacterium]